MLKKIAFGGVGLVLLATPLLTSALTVQEQIAALLTQLNQLQQQIATLSASISNTTTSSSGSDTAILAPGEGTPGYNHLACNAVTRRLYRGLNGADVMALQNFLIAEGLLASGSVTGYYGVQTESAVQLWQSSHDIISSGDPETTGWGVLGPKTLMAMRQPDCSDTAGDGGTTTGGTPNVQASPPSGRAPLTVSFTITNSRSTADSGIYYTITFGDGQTDRFPPITPFTLTHTYTSPGTYTATVTEREQCSAWECTGPFTIVRSVVISVGGTSSTAAAVSGSVSGNTVNTTYKNLPSNSYIQLINQQTGSLQSTVASGVSGSGTATASSVPSGTYLLRVKQYGVGVDPIIAESSSFTVGGTTSTSDSTPSASLSQSADTTASGDAYTVSWSSKNATSCKVTYTGPDGGATISSGPTSGSQTFTTATAGTYTGTNTCTGYWGTTTISPPITHTVTSTANPTNQSATISGSGSVVSGTGIVTVVYTNLPANSYIQLINQQTGNLLSTLAPTASGIGSTAVSSVPAGTYILRVKQYAVGSDPTIVESSSFTVSGTTTTTDSTPALKATLTQTSASTAAGVAYTLNWDSTNAVSCTVAYTGPDGGATISSGPTVGSQTFNTPTVGTFIATNTCTSSTGATASQSLTHTVTANSNPNSLPIVYTDASTNITATSVTLNGRVNSAGTTGTTGWFRASATNPGTCNDTFGTRSSESDDTAFAAGYLTTSFSLAVTGLTPGTTYYYCAIAKNPFGKSYGNVVSLTTPSSGTTGTASTPTLDATLKQSTPSTVSGDPYTLTWGSSENATSCTLSYTGPDGGGTISSGPTSGGPQTFTTPTVGTYVATNTCTGPGGTDSATVTHTVTANTTTTDTSAPNSLPIVGTVAATSITASTATLNGTVNPAGTTGTTGWFRGGTTNPGTCNNTFGTRVPSAGGTSFSPVYQKTSFSENVTGLTSGTTYYYCAIAENQFGKTYGNVVSFTSSVASAASLSQIANALSALQETLNKLYPR
ncbi:hypothetical protein A3A37_00760 [Candidatus Kaiserbacteria bacterium RIFCSPLOWO2_01_FULL_52_36]|nr:MAG: hypothetical protein A3A37_00760 [Candidatus Kaiserbacteria bacterium RIFCSPLOWO2_01_FULL_52_36]